MSTKLNRELVELKYRILKQKINEILNKLKLKNKITECSKDIKAMETINASFEKMYQAVIESEEYDKYIEVENTIIAQVSKIESDMDKYIYKLSKQYQEHIDSIRKSENFRKFRNLEDELEKTNALRDLLSLCAVYQSSKEQEEIMKMIYLLKFRILMRKQLQQIVYENGGSKSWLTEYDNEEEKVYFKQCLEDVWKCIGEDKLLDKYNYDIEKVMSDCILLNHLVYKLVIKDIEKDTGLYNYYTSLLDAPIFSPRMCNIEDDPFSEKIAYAPKGFLNDVGPMGFWLKMDQKDWDQKTDFLMRNKINLSLLLALLESNIIKTESTTIAECSNIFRRFGFECKPVTISEGQEIVSKIFDKVKHRIKPKDKDLSQSKGQYCKLSFTGYNYDFKKVEMPFLTTAEIRDYLQTNDKYSRDEEIKRINYSESQSETDLSLGDMNVLLDMRRRTVGFMNIDSWMLPLDEDKIFKLRRTPIPAHFADEGDPRAVHFMNFWGRRIYGYIDYDALYQSYKTDLTDLGIRTKYIGKRAFLLDSFNIAINLDDIAELPIDYDMVQILTEKEVGDER